MDEERLRSQLILSQMPQARRWRTWWVAYGVILRIMRLIPVAEWRREQWSHRLDIWGMGHFGQRRRVP